MSNGIRASVELELQIRAEEGTLFGRRLSGSGRIAGTGLEALGEGGLFSSDTSRRDVGVSGKVGWRGY